MINTGTPQQAKKQERQPANVVLKIVGWLGHDNNLFDCTCPQCGGIYSSYKTRNCPKCNAALTSITTKEGKPMAISEGTIYPAFGPETKKKALAATQARKNGIEIKYRFKVFSFADANGVLAPPALHHELKSGAMVEIVTINHPPIASWFKTDAGQPQVELMFSVWPHYDDTIKVLAPPKAAEATISYPANADGSPAPIAPPYQGAKPVDEVASLQQEIAQLKAKLGQSTDNKPVDATLQEVDPFNAAS